MSIEKPVNSAQAIMSGDQYRKQPTMAETFNNVARAAGKATIMQKHENGFFIWVTENETDPVAALLHAAIGIMAARGVTSNGHSIEMRRSELLAKDLQVFWSVTGADGELIAKGYAADERAAGRAMLPHLTQA